MSNDDEKSRRELSFLTNRIRKVGDEISDNTEKVKDATSDVIDSTLEDEAPVIASAFDSTKNLVKGLMESSSDETVDEIKKTNKLSDETGDEIKKTNKLISGMDKSLTDKLKDVISAIGDMVDKPFMTDREKRALEAKEAGEKGPIKKRGKDSKKGGAFLKTLMSGVTGLLGMFTGGLSKLLVIGGLFTSLSGIVVSMFTWVSGILSKGWGLLKVFGGSILNLITKLGTFIKPVLGVLKTVGGSILNLLSKIGTFIKPVLGVLKTVGKVFLKFALIVGLIFGAWNAISEIADNWSDPDMTIMDKVWAAVGAFIEGFTLGLLDKELLGNIATQFTNSVSEMADSLLGMFDNIDWAEVLSFVTSLPSEILSAMMFLPEKLWKSIEELLPTIEEWFSSLIGEELFESLKKQVMGKIDDLGNSFSVLIDDIREKVGGVFDKVLGVFKYVINKLSKLWDMISLDGAKKMVGSAVDSVGSAVDSTKNWVSGLMGSSSDETDEGIQKTNELSSSDETNELISGMDKSLTETVEGIQKTNELISGMDKNLTYKLKDVIGAIETAQVFQRNVSTRAVNNSENTSSRPITNGLKTSAIIQNSIKESKKPGPAPSNPTIRETKASNDQTSFTKVLKDKADTVVSESTSTSNVSTNDNKDRTLETINSIIGKDSKSEKSLEIRQQGMLVEDAPTLLKNEGKSAETFKGEYRNYTNNVKSEEVVIPKPEDLIKEGISSKDSAIIINRAKKRLDIVRKLESEKTLNSADVEKRRETDITTADRSPVDVRIVSNEFTARRVSKFDTESLGAAKNDSSINVSTGGNVSNAVANVSNSSTNFSVSPLSADHLNSSFSRSLQTNYLR